MLNTNSVIWQDKLDKKYDIIVKQDLKSPYKGTLYVYLDIKELYHKEVNISYGAAYGPDLFDIAEWQKIAADFVDGLGK